MGEIMQKKYVVLIAIIVIYILVMILIFGIDRDTITNNTYIVIGENTRWKYVDDEWSKLEITDSVFNRNKFKVYKDQKYKGNYFIQNYDDTWYFFDDQNVSHDLYGQLFAYKSDRDIEVVSFTGEEPSLMEIKSLLNKYSIQINSFEDLSKAQKISMDFDKDGINEYIYSLSNYMSETASNNLFSIVVYVDNDKPYEIIKNLDDNVRYIYSVSNIIDVNEDKNYEIIIEHEKPLNASMNCHSMHGLKKGKYDIIKSCE